MRAVVQTVGRAAVKVGGQVVGTIADGLLVYVGVTHTDTALIAERLARQVHELRILAGEVCAAESGAPLLVVSQFTLYADTSRGRRPSWSQAAPADVAAGIVAAFTDALRARGAIVETGSFQAHMLVESINVGPRTIILEI